MKRLSSLINPELTRRTHQLERIDQLLKSTLPVAAHQHIQAVNIADRELVVTSDSPAWSTRLRLHINDILYMLDQYTDYGITSIHIRLLRNRNPARSTPTPKKPILLSKNSSQAIQQAAESVSDPELKNSLLKLSKRIASDQ